MTKDCEDERQQVVPAVYTYWYACLGHDLGDFLQKRSEARKNNPINKKQRKLNG